MNDEKLKKQLGANLVSYRKQFHPDPGPPWRRS